MAALHATEQERHWTLMGVDLSQEQNKKPKAIIATDVIN